MYCTGICEDGDIRLVDGSIQSEGRVEICINDTWLVLCDNPTNPQRESRDRLICRQLGYPDVLHKLRGLPQGSAPFLPQDLYCVGVETSLMDCEPVTITESECDVVGVSCENVTGTYANKCLFECMKSQLVF